MGDAGLRLSVSVSAETTTDVIYCTTACNLWLKVTSPQGELQGTAKVDGPASPSRRVDIA
jgi:hypothetical protein